MNRAVGLGRSQKPLPFKRLKVGVEAQKPFLGVTREGSPCQGPQRSVILSEGYPSAETVTLGQFRESEHWGPCEPAKATEPPLGEVKSPRAPPTYACGFPFQGPQFVTCVLALAPAPGSGPRVPEPAQDSQTETVVVCVSEAGGG